MNHPQYLFSAGQLSKKEWTRFGKFVQSPYHNTSKLIPAYYQLLNRYFPDFSQYKLTPEALFYRLFEEGTYYRPATIQRLFRQFDQLFEHFLIVEAATLSPFEQNRVLVSEFMRRGQLSLAEAVFKRLLSHQGSLTSDEARAGAKTIAMWLLSGKIPESSARFEALLLLGEKWFAQGHALENQWLKLLRLARNRIYSPIKEMPSVPGHGTLAGNLAAYFEQDQHEFHEFLSLKKQWEKLPDTTPHLGQLYYLLVLAAPLPDIIVSPEMQAQLYDFYLLGDQSGWLAPNGCVHLRIFLSLTFQSARLKQFEQTQFWIEKYAPLLPKPFQQPAREIGYARLHFERREWTPVSKILCELSALPPALKPEMRILELQNLYEQTIENPSLLETLYAKIAATQKFISRFRHTSNARRQAYTRFNQTLQKLSRHHFDHPFEKGLTAHLPAEIFSAPVVQAGWLWGKMHFHDASIKVK